MEKVLEERVPQSSGQHCGLPSTHRRLCLGQQLPRGGPGALSAGSAWRTQAFAWVSGVRLFQVFAKTNGTFLNFLELWGKQARGRKTRLRFIFLPPSTNERESRIRVWLGTVKGLESRPRLLAAGQARAAPEGPGRPLSLRVSIRVPRRPQGRRRIPAASNPSVHHLPAGGKTLRGGGGEEGRGRSNTSRGPFLSGAFAP